MPSALAWGILTFVFVDEVLAAVAAGVWGSHVAGLPGAIVGPGLVVALWWTFASPKAPLGHPAAKVLILGACAVGLWHAGHPGWALAFGGFSLVVNGLAQLRGVKDVTATFPT